MRGVIYVTDVPPFSQALNDEQLADELWDMALGYFENHYVSVTDVRLVKTTLVVHTLMRLSHDDAPTDDDRFL